MGGWRAFLSADGNPAPRHGRQAAPPAPWLSLRAPDRGGREQAPSVSALPTPVQAVSALLLLPILPEADVIVDGV